jgi:hypothetical protein
MRDISDPRTLQLLKEADTEFQERRETRSQREEKR